jgi:hypothetical protein
LTTPDLLNKAFEAALLTTAYFMQTLTPENWFAVLLSWGPPSVVLGVALWTIYTGRFHTRASVNALIKLYEGQIVELKTDRDDYKQIARDATEALAELTRPANIAKTQPPQAPRKVSR